MRLFSDEQIRDFRDNFRQKYPERTADIGAYKFNYFVFPQDLNPDIPDFAVAMCSETDSLFGVSDSIDERFRDYWAFHEFVEYTELRTVQDRCTLALERELPIVHEQIKPEYLRRRLDFFRNLVLYAQAHESDFEPSDVDNFNMSLSRLEQLVK